MAIRVKTPDGYANFPDGTPPARIEAALRAHYAPPAAPPPANGAPKASLLGDAKAFGSGALNAFGSLGNLFHPGGDPDVTSAVNQGGQWLATHLGGQSQARAANGFRDAENFRRMTLGPTTTEAQQTAGLYHAPQNTQEEIAGAAGGMLPNAFVPGAGEANLARTLGGATVRVLAPAFASVGARHAAKADGAGPIGQTLAGAAGGVIGGGVAGAATAPEAAIPRSVTSLTPVEQDAASKFARVVKPDINAITGKAAQYSAAGIEPTLIDTTGDTGQGVTRALASRQTSARDAVKAFARTRALALPDRIADQAKAIVSTDPRSVDQIASEIDAARMAHNNQAMAPIRGDVLQITPGMGAALTSEDGIKAVLRAGARQIDPAERSEFQGLADRIKKGDGLDGSPITVGQAHDISQALYDRADSATDMGDKRALSAFGAIVRDGAKDQSDPYNTVMDQGTTAHRLAEAPAIGAKGLTSDRNAFAADIDAVNQIPALPDPQGVVGAPNGNALARAGFVRAIENATGDPRIGGAPGAAYKIADTPGQQARNAALLGPNDAALLQNNLRLEADAVDNARNANPRAGSNTMLNTQDAAVADNVGKGGQAIGAAAGLAHGPLGAVNAVVTGAKLWLASKGFSDAEAEAMANMAIDPAKHDDVVNYIASKAGPQAAQTFSSQIQQAAGGLANAAASPAALIPATIAATNAFRAQNAPSPAAGQ